MSRSLLAPAPTGRPLAGPLRGPDPDANAAVAGLARALRGREGELAARMAAVISAGDPMYGGSGKVSRDELLQACSENLREVLLELTGPASPGPRARSSATATGRRRAQEGIPLENVLHAYRLGGRVIWEALVDAAREAGPRFAEPLARGASVVWEGIDLYSTAMVEAYRHAEAELRGRDQGRRHELLHALLSGTVDAGEVDFAPEALGLGTSVPWVVAVADARTGSPERLAQLLAAAGLGSEWAFLQGRLAGLVEAGEGGGGAAAALRRSRRERVGLSAPFDSPGAAPAAHRQAELALRSLPPGEDRVVEMDDDLPAVLLAAAPELAERLARQALGQVLRERDGPTLLRTLQLFVRSGGSVGRTAAALPCHRNTVCNRLARVEQLSGLGVAEPEQLARLALALKAVRLLGLGGVPPSTGAGGGARC